MARCPKKRFEAVSMAEKGRILLSALKKHLEEDGPPP